jgi:hypothetical protein
MSTADTIVVAWLLLNLIVLLVVGLGAVTRAQNH